MSEKPNNEDKWEFIHRLDSLAIQKQKEEIERLQAEVERLTFENGNNSVMKEEWYLKCMSARAEVERLRKAGDAMCKFFDDHGFYGFGFQEAWNAAKEGKPSV